MTESVLLATTPHRANRPLHVTLLGPPQLAADGQLLPLPRRQLRALLYRLAVELQPVPREQLCFLLWPDIPEAAARRHLTVLLNQLRQALPSLNVVLTPGDIIALDSRHFQADTVAFAEASALAARSGKLEPLAEAVNRYAGPFLQGFSLPASAEFDAWVAQERQHWERRYLDAQATLVDGYTTSGAYAFAIAAAQRALAVDELAEDMHRHLIALYAAQGDRTAALRQFEHCVLALERELGVGPLPETRAVYEAVRAGYVPLRQSAGGTLRSARVPPPAALEDDARAGSRAAQATHRHSLPAPSASLIGRQTELTAIRAILTDQLVQLLTLTGTGGSGKTRLALQAAWDVAERFADGAVFVALAPLQNPALVLQLIGHACGLTQPSPAALAEHLRDKQLLLVLDNCEHLLAAVPEIAALLAAAPGLRVLATSRAALNLDGEHAFPVPPLPLPDLAHMPPLAELADVPSVALLLARTRALNPRFHLTADNAADLAAICVRLDGLPLAIELAAARLKLLAPRDLLRRLNRRLTLLTSGSRDLPERQQTLRATIDWSYRLLSFAEQLWFERCSVFAGGWTLGAIEALDKRMRWPTAPQGLDDAAESSLLDVLTALVEQSLVQFHVADDGEMRFGMLETIREFAAERLHERGAFEAVAQAHADFYLSFVEHLEQAGIVQATPEWNAAIERDHDNLRATLRWFLDQGAIEQAIKLGLSLYNFWYWREYEREGRQWLEEIVARSAHIRTLERAQAMFRLGLLAGAQGDMKAAVALYEEILQLCRDLPLATLHASARGALGTQLARQGNYPRAIILLEEALVLVRQLEIPRAISGASVDLAYVLADQGQDIDRAIELFEEGRAIAHELRWTIHESNALSGLGMLLTLTGDYARAEVVLAEGLRIQQELKAIGAMGWTCQYLGMLAYEQKEYARAQQYFTDSLAIAAPANALNTVPMSFEGLAGVAAMWGRPTQAARLLGAAEALRERLEIKLSPLEQPYYNRMLATVRAQLAEALLRDAWQAGRQLTIEQVIAEAKAFARSEAEGHRIQERQA